MLCRSNCYLVIYLSMLYVCTYFLLSSTAFVHCSSYVGLCFGMCCLLCTMSLHGLVYRCPLSLAAEYRGPNLRPSVCDFNAYQARGASPPLGDADPFLSVSCKRVDDTTIFSVSGTQFRADTASRLMYRNDIRQTFQPRNNVQRM